ncbi:Rad1-domain-containing protein [Schizophyllum commune Tattone D]|nr:Rad1-domain-containing protein [Schizophyllum commune Tattone D]
MMSQSQSQADSIPPILQASVHDVRFFAGMLRGVSFANRATIAISPDGLKVIVEEARSILGVAYIWSGIFDEFTYTAPDPEDLDTGAAFEVPLSTVLECLNIFGSAGPGAASSSAAHKKWRRAEDEEEGEDGDGAGRRRGGKGIEHYIGASGDNRTGMRLSFLGEGHPMVLLLAEDASGPITTCHISTSEADPHLDLPFDPDNTALQIILKSSWLRDALSELDPSIEKLTFVGNPKIEEPDVRRRAANAAAPPLFRIRAEGSYGSTEMDYPDDREVLETFECVRTIQYSYRFPHILKTLKAVQNSTKTSLRIDEEGLLSLQYLMPYTRPRGGERLDCFVEYRCLPLDNED